MKNLLLLQHTWAILHGGFSDENARVLDLNPRSRDQWVNEYFISKCFISAVLHSMKWESYKKSYRNAFKQSLLITISSGIFPKISKFQSQIYVATDFLRFFSLFFPFFSHENVMFFHYFFPNCYFSCFAPKIDTPYWASSQEDGRKLTL